MPYAAVAFHDHAHAPFSRNRSAGYLHARRFSSSRSALAERCAAPIQTLMAGIPRNFEVFDPLDFLAEVTQHIPHRVKNIIKSVRLGTGTLYTAEAKLTIKASTCLPKPRRRQEKTGKSQASVKELFINAHPLPKNQITYQLTVNMCNIIALQYII